MAGRAFLIKHTLGFCFGRVWGENVFPFPQGGVSKPFYRLSHLAFPFAELFQILVHYRNKPRNLNCHWIRLLGLGVSWWFRGWKGGRVDTARQGRPFLGGELEVRGFETLGNIEDVWDLMGLESILLRGFHLEENV